MMQLIKGRRPVGEPNEPESFSSEPSSLMDATLPYLLVQRFNPLQWYR